MASKFLNAVWSLLGRVPQDLPTPVDFIVENANVVVRVVPNVHRLITVQIEIPESTFDRIAAQIKEWPDVEDWAFRLTRRGRANNATNIYLDKKNRHVSMKLHEIDWSKIKPEEWTIAPDLS